VICIICIIFRFNTNLHYVRQIAADLASFLFFYLFFPEAAQQRHTVAPYLGVLTVFGVLAVFCLLGGVV
jgi:hypothetical protein